jgi:hypothetical protein
MKLKKRGDTKPSRLLFVRKKFFLKMNTHRFGIAGGVVIVVGDAHFDGEVAVVFVGRNSVINRRMGAVA